MTGDAAVATRLSVLVPVYNNEATLEALCSRLHQALHAIDYEVLLVNDGSRDHSLDILRQLAQSNPRLKVISLSRNFGQHPAIAAAIDHAVGDVLVLMDADLEDQPEQIPMLVQTLTDRRCDIVYTTNIGGREQRLTSDVYHRVFSRMVDIRLPKRLGTFRAFTRKVCDALRQFPERQALYGPLMFFIGFTYAIVPVERGSARASSYTFFKRLRIAVSSLVTYTDLPPRLFGIAGVVMVALSILYGAAILLQYFIFDRRLPQGLTLVVLLLTFMTGMLMAALGVLGEYVFRIFQEVLARPRYLIDESLNVVRNSFDGQSRS
jgi:glycosyltransferase involved in cell wall biosynthesis